MEWVILYIISGLLFGALSRQIMINKGYYDEDGNMYFALGFFLGIFGLILAVAKPDVHRQSQDKMMYDYFRAQSGQNNAIQTEWECSCGEENPISSNYCLACGNRKPNTRSSTVSSEKAKDTDWRCSCGALNKDYETSCHRCGTLYSTVEKNASQSTKAHQPQTKSDNNNASPQNTPVVTANSSITDQITELKSLLENGLITEEEFNAKKKQILGL